MLDLTPIKARLEDVTEGPWIPSVYGFQIVTNDRRRSLYQAVGKNPQYEQEANASFVSHARQDVPDLVAEVERLCAVLLAIADRTNLELEHHPELVYAMRRKAQEALK